MKQQNLFEVSENTAITGQCRTEDTAPQRDESPFVVKDGAIHCRDCGRVITPEYELPVDEWSVTNAFLSIAPESAAYYLDLASGEIFSLSFDDDSEDDPDGLREMMFRTPERYLYLEPLTVAEFINIVSNFALKLPESMAKVALERAIEGEAIQFPSDVDELLSTYPDIRLQWNRFLDQEVFSYAREWIEDYAGTQINSTFDDNNMKDSPS